MDPAAQTVSRAVSKQWQQPLGISNPGVRWLGLASTRMQLCPGRLRHLPEHDIARSGCPQTVSAGTARLAPSRRLRYRRGGDQRCEGPPPDFWGQKVSRRGFATEIRAPIDRPSARPENKTLFHGCHEGPPSRPGPLRTPFPFSHLALRETLIKHTSAPPPRSVAPTNAATR
jgi:hypothetical protein